MLNFSYLAPIRFDAVKQFGFDFDETEACYDADTGKFITPPAQPVLGMEEWGQALRLATLSLNYFSSLIQAAILLLPEYLYLVLN